MTTAPNGRRMGAGEPEPAVPQTAEAEFLLFVTREAIDNLPQCRRSALTNFHSWLCNKGWVPTTDPTITAKERYRPGEQYGQVRQVTTPDGEIVQETDRELVQTYLSDWTHELWYIECSVIEGEPVPWSQLETLWLPGDGMGIPKNGARHA